MKTWVPFTIVFLFILFVAILLMYNLIVLNRLPVSLQYLSGHPPIHQQRGRHSTRMTSAY